APRPAHKKVRSTPPPSAAQKTPGGILGATLHSCPRRAAGKLDRDRSAESADAPIKRTETLFPLGINYLAYVIDGRYSTILSPGVAAIDRVPDSAVTDSVDASYAVRFQWSNYDMPGRADRFQRPVHA